MKILKCRKCGEEVYPDEKRCSHCGASLSWLRKLAPCRDCGELVSKTASRCPYCGVRYPNKIWFATQLVSAILLIFCAYYCLNLIEDAFSSQEPTSPTTTGQSQSHSYTEPEEPEEIIEISAVDLWNAYQKNEVGADLLYEGKTILITGVVIDIGKDSFSDKPCVSLDTGSPEIFSSIQCFFSKSIKNQTDIASLSVGDTVTICGKCSGEFFSDVQLTNCFLAND